MVYKEVFSGDFMYDFKFDGKYTKTDTENFNVIQGIGKDSGVMQLIMKKPVPYTIPEGITKLIIHGYIDDSLVTIPKTVKALEIMSNPVKKLNLTIPMNVKELIIAADGALEVPIDVSKMKNLRSLTYARSPKLKKLGILPDKLEYLTLSNMGFKTFPKNLPISLVEIRIKRFKNVINFPDLSYLKNLKFIGFEYTAVSKFSKISPPVKAYLYFLEIPTGSAKFPPNYRDRPESIFITDPYYHVIDGKVVFIRPTSN